MALLVGIIGGLIYRNLKRTKVYNLNLREALAELERGNKNYIRIMRVMAHDIINPLAGMTGVASVMLLEERLSPALEEQARLIETSGLHALAMVKELLKTGLGNENDQMDFEETDLNVLLKDSIELLRFQANEKGQKLLFQSTVLPIRAEVNREKIWRVINNIIGNAIKFTRQNGEISVRLTEKDDTIIFSVSDNGVGIADKDRELVFEMFTPAKKIGTSGEKPFGLGLSICKKIVEKHLGEIWFENNEKSGTTFFVELPKSNKDNSHH